MATTNPDDKQKTIEKVRAQAENQFLDPFLPDDKFGQLDLSSHPTLQGLPEDSENEWIDRRFASLAQQSKPLGPELVALLRKAQEGDPEALEDLKRAGIKVKPASETVFVAKQRGILTHRNGKYFLQIGEDVWESGLNQNRDEFLLEINAELDDRNPVLFELTPSQRMFIARQVQGGDPSGAAQNYLAYRLGEKRTKEISRQIEISGDPYCWLDNPTYKDLQDECAIEIWKLRTPSYVETIHGFFMDLVDQARSQTPLDAKKIDALWLAFLDQFEQNKRRINPEDYPHLFSQPEAPIAEQLEEADDATIERTMAALRAARAKGKV